MAGDPCKVELELHEALSIYIFFLGREEELSGSVAAFFGRLRDYLYERLSIEELEKPDELLARIAPGG
ncbi:MAG TPA: hypothetical protein VMC79_10260 [Rectinemataceae bacterium]|nr:hypothetical protein [Rectinemataceae bacterium]